MRYIPKEIAVISRRSRIVGAAFIDDRELQALIGLGRAGDIDVHSVQNPIPIGVKFCFYPEVFPNPFLWVLKSRYFLRLSVFKNGPNLCVEAQKRGSRYSDRKEMGVFHGVWGLAVKVTY